MYYFISYIEKECFYINNVIQFNEILEKCAIHFMSFQMFLFNRMYDIDYVIIITVNFLMSNIVS